PSLRAVLRAVGYSREETDATRHMRGLRYIAGKAKATWSVLASSGAAFYRDEPFRLAASLAYYTLLSMAPLLLIVIATAGAFFGKGAVRGEVVDQIGALAGPDGARVAETLIENASKIGGSVGSILLGGGLMLFGATTVFAELQSALNHVWHVKAEPTNALWGFLRHRLLSFALILSIGFLLAVSLIISALLAALEVYLTGFGLAEVAVWRGLNAAASFAVFTVLIAMIFKYLPDAIIAWRDVWFGAVITSVLFVAGKYLIGLYLGQAGIGSVFGAAGSVVVFMVWVYYAGLIFFFGAEITRAVARQRGSAVRPSEHAREAAD
ncbi:MAG TPA: YihY/virulence factor BrkB family protein, partial [Gammaproteobacteria bacterium]|nr:YihY/virulence factor BrkB family protein [Gammaproteobacteria bacterium]